MFDGVIELITPCATFPIEPVEAPDNVPRTLRTPPTTFPATDATLPNAFNAVCNATPSYSNVSSPSFCC